MHELLNGLVENNLSIKEKARLQTLLEESEWAREQYVRFMDMSASMGHYAEELIGDDFEKLVNPISKIQSFDLFLLFCQNCSYHCGRFLSFSLNFLKMGTLFNNPLKVNYRSYLSNLNFYQMMVL